MQAFAYATPGTLADAARLAAQEDAKYLAGGQTLVAVDEVGPDRAPAPWST